MNLSSVYVQGDILMVLVLVALIFFVAFIVGFAALTWAMEKEDEYTPRD